MNLNHRGHNVFTKYTMLRALCFLCVLCGFRISHAQDTSDFAKPLIPKSELWQLVDIADSLHTELKELYKKEAKTNSPNAYQPERIAIVRTYLLLFDYVQKRCEVARFKKSDIQYIFGKPDTILYEPRNKRNYQFYYDKVIKKYVRIVNLRYRFYFENDELVRVIRENS